MSYPEWHARRPLPMIDRDMPTFMGQPYAICQDDLKDADVVIIGAPYVTGWEEWAGIPRKEWLAGSKRVRQQSCKYPSGYIQDFDLDIFEHLKLVDYGDAAIPPEVFDKPTVENVLAAQRAVEVKVNEVLDAGAIPIVIGQNSPCGSYAIAKPIAERTKGNVGVVNLDLHPDLYSIDLLTMDPRIAGAVNWMAKLYEFHENVLQKNLVAIGGRGPCAARPRRDFISKGAHFYPMWNIREKGIEWLCEELRHAYNGTKAIYVRYDLDVIGGAGSASGELFGTMTEPLGMEDYELLRISFEIGKRGFNALSFIDVPLGSPVMYLTVVYVIMYRHAGYILG